MVAATQGLEANSQTRVTHVNWVGFADNIGDEVANSVLLDEVIGGTGSISDSITIKLPKGARERLEPM